jgi:hypothetical protein
MITRAEEYWKTFNLCKELAITGNFIYNGLKSFDEMESFYFAEDIFDFLYSISVGIERLIKITIILKEDVTPDKQEELEKSLITHNHLELMKRITKTEKKDVSSLSYSFLQLLSNFYNSWRYDRFSLSSLFNYDKEKVAFVAFLEKYLKVHIENENLFVTKNDRKYKVFIGRTVGKIVQYLYKIIERESSRLNIYTYEIRIDTKAYKIFIKEEYDFTSEEIFWKELLIYILHNVDKNQYLELYKSMEPLEFDDGNMAGMIKALRNDLLKLEYLGDLDYLYDEIENKKDRFEFLDLIGNETLYFPDDNEDEGKDNQ